MPHLLFPWERDLVPTAKEAGRTQGQNTEWFKAIILSLQSLQLIQLQGKLIIHNIFTMPKHNNMMLNHSEVCLLHCSLCFEKAAYPFSFKASDRI